MQPVQDNSRCDKHHRSAAAGEAINPRNLSWVECLLGDGKHYNKQLDREDMYDDSYAEATRGKTQDQMDSV